MAELEELIESYINLTITASVLLVLDIVQQQHIPLVLYGLIVAAGGVGNLPGAAHTLWPHASLCSDRVRGALASLWLHHDATAVGSRLRGDNPGQQHTSAHAHQENNDIRPGVPSQRKDSPKYPEHQADTKDHQNLPGLHLSCKPWNSHTEQDQDK
jgi:hypothetical protein